MSIRRRHFLKGMAAAGAAASGIPLLGVSTAHADDAPKKGGTLRVGVIGSSADTLDAAAYVSNADLVRALQLFDGLAETDENFQVRLALAEEITANSPEEWIIRLRQGVTFHNGKPVTADDVIFSIRRIIDPKKPYQGSQGLNMIDMNGMTKLDERTVKLKMNSPNAYLVEELTQIWNPVVPVDFDPATAIGTGPYKLKSFVPGRQSVFVRNENYWREAPYIDELVLINFSDETARLNALIGGQLDVVPAASHGQMRIAQASSGVKIFNEPSARWDPICMRCDIDPFKDIRVRQALRLLVDREQVVKQVYAGNARLGNDLFGAMDAEYAGDLPQRHQDIDQAKSLFKAAGAENLSLEIITAPLSSTLVQWAEVYAQQAKKTGLNVQVRKIDPGSFYGADYLKRPFTQDSWGNFPLVPIMSLTILPGAGNNETGWYDDETISLVAQARAQLDKGKRAELVHEVQKVLYDRGGYIIPALINMLTFHSAKVSGFKVSTGPNSDFNFQYRKVWLSS